MKKIMSKILIFTLTITMLITGCSTRSNNPMTYNGVFFDTVISISIYDSDDESLLSGVEDICEKYDKLLSRTNPDSEISQINNADGEPTSVSAETAELIEDTLAYSEASGGLFDITIADIVNIWNFNSEDDKDADIPDESLIKEELTHVDYKKVNVSGNVVTLQDPEMQIDLGGIAKGYIADIIKEYLESKSVKSALINLGGNVQTIGKKSDNTEFNIGIQKPFDTNGTPITSIKLNDESSVTSGIYERYFEKDGKIYHHIIDPKTGYPCDNDLYSVTIISSSSTKADALSTTCFLLGLDKGLELINSMDDGTKAIFITSDDKLHYSDGF
ncbi:MAG: FAD:protein FMN transferase [Suipraeoptans sp.]